MPISNDHNAINAHNATFMTIGDGSGDREVRIQPIRERRPAVVVVTAIVQSIEHRVAYV
jgi:hypothetical protein